MSKIFTIYGNPISHSISPLLHNYTIKSFGIDACYTRVKLSDAKDLKKSFLNSGFSGANITVPFKEEAYKICDEVYGIANKIKAINTIILKDNKLIGYNTDAPGFFEAIKEFKDINTALILGAGGTAKATANILKQNHIKTTILNRSEQRLHYFIEQGFKSYSWSSFNIDTFNIIINTTSAGLNDEKLPLDEDVLRELIKKTDYCVDVIYNRQTPFLRLAKEYKKPHKDGSDMLLYQAVLAFDVFFDFKYKKEDIKRYMLEALSLL